MRLEQFGGRVVRISEALPSSRTGRHIQDQLLRAGTAVGAHYAEAQGAQSRKDFVYKLSVALKEAGEARYWLGVILHARDEDNLEVSPLIWRSHRAYCDSSSGSGHGPQGPERYPLNLRSLVSDVRCPTHSIRIQFHVGFMRSSHVSAWLISDSRFPVSD
ncbi:MAG: four helix bundle protein [Bradymonadaceae bacterium]